MLAVWLGWLFVIAAGGYFYAVTLSRYVHFDAEHYRHYWPAKWWLVAHLGGGSLALLLGPLQFSSFLRRRYAIAHRWIGRIYLLGILIGSLAAIYMGLYVSPNKAFGVALLYLAFAWLTTSSMAYLAALRRQFAAHREWMIRSYVVTFAFVLYRVGKDLHVFSSLGKDIQPVMLGWGIWAVPLLLTEVVLQWKRTVGAFRALNAGAQGL